MHTSAGSPGHRARSALAAVACVAALGLIASCGAAPAPAGGSGGWTFTDGHGEKVSLAERPTRVVAFSSVAAALWDYGFEVVGVFGPVDGTDGEPAPQIGSVDTEKVATVSQTYGEMSIERLADLEPDLIVTQSFGDLVWYLPEDKLKQIEAVAPVATLQTTGVSAPQLLESHLDLAVALGVDPKSAKVTAARKEYDDAIAELDTATEDNPEIDVLAVTASADKLFVGNVAAGGDLALFKEHGARFPETDAPKSDQFEELSWEEADKYPVDLLLQDNRPGRTTVKDLAAVPLWKELPAVKAGQVGDWSAETPYSYGEFAAVITTLADDIATAEPLEH